MNNFQPMQKREDEIMNWGTPIKHPRQADAQAEPSALAEYTEGDGV